jgi:hypothetical protein
LFSALLEKSSSSVPFAEESPSEELPQPVTVPTSNVPAINVQISFLFIFLSSIILLNEGCAALVYLKAFPDTSVLLSFRWLHNIVTFQQNQQVSRET